MVDMAGWTGAQLVEYECCLLLVNMAGWTGAQLVEYECCILGGHGWWDWSLADGLCMNAVSYWKTLLVGLELR
jgi:hypothetical protein